MTGEDPSNAATARAQWWRLFEEGFTGSRQALWLNGLIVALIIGSVVAVILETHRPLWAAYAREFAAFEILSVAVFTIEYVVRLWTCVENPRYAGMHPLQARLRYAVSPLALVDLIAVLPAYLALFWNVDLRYLRMFRLVRIFKLSHYFSGVNLFLRVLRSELSSLGAALFVIVILIVVSAILMYYLESDAQPEEFRSVADSIWWSVVTLTTVGYGDVTPATFGGRLLAIVIMLLGIGTVAIPAGLLAAKFTEELQRRRLEFEQEVRSALEDGYIDEDEQKALEELCDEMGLDAEQVEQIVAHEREIAARHNRCPHCGRELNR